MNAETRRFQAGQVWAFRTRPQEPASTLLIMHVDHHERLGTCVHIRVDGLQLRSPYIPGGVQTAVPFLPVAADALERSVTFKLQDDAPLPDFAPLCDEWRVAFDEGEAGVWDLSVRDIIGALEHAINSIR